MPYSPLGRGFLTGEAKRAEEHQEGDFRRAGDPRVSGENFAANQKAVEAIKALAEAKGATPAQVALAWVLHQGSDLAPIPGTKRRHYLEQNLAAAELVFTPAELETLEAAFPAGGTAGARYQPEMMAQINR